MHPRAPRRSTLAAAAAALLLVTACVPATSLPDDCSADTAQRQATLSGETLDPSTIEVCRGQTVSIVLTIQVDAELHFHGYDEQVPAREVHSGETVTIEFAATQAGQFPIEIHTTDGPAEATVGTFIVNEP